MDAVHRLLRFGRTAQQCALPVWQSAKLQSERGLQWLKLRPHIQAPLFSVGMGIVTLLLLIFSGVTAAVAALAAWFTLIRHFAQTNADRQRRITESFSKAVEQLGSDKLEVRLGGIYSLERISKESPDDYWTVMENLTAFVRERSRRNEAERTSQGLEQRVSRRAYFLWQEAGRPDGKTKDFWAAAAKQEKLGEPAADIAAVLTVLKRRSEQSREREGTNGWCFDLKGAILKRYDLSGAHLEAAILGGARLEGADLNGAHLERADLSDDAHLEGADLIGAHLEAAILGGAHLEETCLSRAHLEGAYLNGAHLDGADLSDAHLEEAVLSGAHLERADLSDAHLEGTYLSGAHLARTNLSGAHLAGAIFGGAHLEGADLSDATGLSEAQLHDAHGDAVTKLPGGLSRPEHWQKHGSGCGSTAGA
jgi:uncharacterized protein YjbI with pentapeptide repeats